LTLKRLSAELEQLEKRIEERKTAATATPSRDEVPKAESYGVSIPVEVSVQEEPQSDIQVAEKAPQEKPREKGAADGATVAEEAAPSTSEVDGNDQVDMEKNKLEVRVSHLQCLHEFITTDLAHLVDVRTKIQESSLETITFENIYHLYSPGDLIINRKDDVDQLYQVYAVTGGRMRLHKFINNQGYRQPGDGQEADNSPEAGIGTWTDVVIDSFRMRWNGTRIGPKRKTHRVQHYTGEKKITDLDYYPVRFRSNAEELCEQLKLRGKAVLECYGHKKYDGLAAKAAGDRPANARARMPYPPPPPPHPGTMYKDSVTEMETAEREVDSDVYVDFKTYSQTFALYSSEFDHLGRVRPSLREVTESSGSAGRDRDYHGGDHDVDEARSDSFLSSNFHLIHPKRPSELGDMQDYLMLLPRSVPAFEFRQRQWGE
jgi:hypothetical protein